MAAVPGDADCFRGGGADLKSVYRCAILNKCERILVCAESVDLLK